ncbi:MAG: YetF domain-containing protein [Anaerolineae bacterium]
MMDLPLPLFLASVGVRTVIVLLALIAGIRIFGKRDLGGMNLVDLVLVMLLGNAVQNALTAGSGHIGVGLVSAGVLILADRLMGILFVRRPWIERTLLGSPTLILHHGRIDRIAMEREGMDEDELLTAIRAQGLQAPAQVRLAVLEEDGSISIVPEE